MKKSQSSFLLSRTNYILMAIGVFIIIIGFILMSGGNPEDTTKFSEDIFSQRRIFWAPATVILGFVLEIIAIFYTPKNNK